MTDPLPDLVVKIKGDASSAVDAFAEVEAAEKSMGNTSDKTSAKIKKNQEDQGKASDDFSKRVKKNNSDSEASFTSLAKAIDAEKAKLAGLQKQFSENASDSLFGDVKKSQSDLNKLLGYAKAMGDNFKTEGDKAGSDFDKGIDKGVRGALDAAKKAVSDLQKVYDNSPGASIFGDLKKAKKDLANMEALGSLLTESFAKEGTSAAGSFVTSFGSSLSSAFEGGMSSPAGMAAIGGLATAAAPVIAATISSAVTTGFGLGITGLGVLAVKDNPGIKTAASNVAGVLKNELSTAASSFVQPVTDGLAIIKRDLLNDQSGFTQLFSAAAPGVTALASGLGGLVSSALPGFIQGMQDAEPVIQELAKDLPGLGTSLGGFVDEVASSPGDVKALTATLKALEGTIAVLGVGLHALTNVMEPVNSAFIYLGNESRGLTNDLGITSAAVGVTGTSALTAADGFGGYADAVAASERELTNFMDVYNTWITDAQNSDDTLLKMDQAWTTFNKELKKGSKNWDENTAAGQKQVGNLNLLNERITDYYGSLAKLHPLTKDQTKAELDAETQLYKTSKAAGASTDELATLKGEISGLNKQLANFKSPPPITLTANVRINETASVRRTMGRLDPGANYANSGVQTGMGSLPHYDASGIYAGGDQPLYRFGEQSVVKEALIAKNGDQGRALSSLREAAGWHGMAVTPATASGAPMPGGRGGAHTLYVNATIVMSGKAVGRSLIGPVNLANAQSSTSIYGT